MEKRKEYAEGDTITCPRCDSTDLDYDDAPDKVKCNSCRLEFSLRTVVIWEE